MFTIGITNVNAYLAQVCESNNLLCVVLINLFHHIIYLQNFREIK